MTLNPERLHQIQSIIYKYHTLFIAQYVGLDMMSDGERIMLEELGFDINSQTELEFAFNYGIISQTLAKSDLKKTKKYEEVKKMIESGNLPPLTISERAAFQHLQIQTYNDLKGLGNRINTSTGAVMIEVDKQQRDAYRKLIGKQITQGALLRESNKEIVSRLGHATGDWSRDFGRIVDYSMHNAFDHGRAVKYERMHGAESLVYKDVFSGSCKHCNRLYLTNGIGSRPILFKLKDLQANATNIGRKVKDWKPVIGATHPYCRCTLNNVPKGFEWDDETGDFTKLKQRERKVKRRSKVSVTVGERTEII